MGDIEDSSGIILKGFFKNFPGLDVQMVGRLVQNKKIRMREHKLGQRNPAPFTAAEFSDLFENIISGKQKSGKDVSNPCIV